jgi:hypothetical protein
MAATEGTKLRVANGKIILHREGVGRVVVNANQSFKFTQKELDDLKETNPDAVRTPVNEEESAVEVKIKPAKGSATSSSGKLKDDDKGDPAGSDKAGKSSEDL